MKPSLLISINFGIFLSYIFTYHCHSKITDYAKDLTGDLQKKHEAIKKERMMHFSIGLILAIVVSLVFYNMPTQFSSLERNNIIILILLLLPMVVYKVLPKSDYMLNHTHPNEQDYKDWFNIYSCMQNQSVYGFLCGFTASMMLLSLMNVD